MGFDSVLLRFESGLWFGNENYSRFLHSTPGLWKILHSFVYIVLSEGATVAEQPGHFPFAFGRLIFQRHCYGEYYVKRMDQEGFGLWKEGDYLCDLLFYFPLFALFEISFSFVNLFQIRSKLFLSS